MTSATRLCDMKGLGPRMTEWLGQIGIHTPDQLRARDPFEVYATLKKSAPGTSMNALYALIGALEERNWVDIKRERRAEILMRLEDMGVSVR